MSVKVAVRVRPFNSREQELQSQNCLIMSNNTTTLKDYKTNKTRDFTFDYSFWSHDGFDITPEGLYIASKDSRYAEQRCFQVSVRKSLKMLYKAIIAVYLHMGRLAQERAIRCWDMELIKV